MFKNILIFILTNINMWHILLHSSTAFQIYMNFCPVAQLIKKLLRISEFFEKPTAMM